MDRLLLSSIFRKLPLKFLLVLLAVCAVFIACFSSAEDLGINVWREKTNGWTTTRDYSMFDKICVLTYNQNNNVSQFSVGGGNRLNTCHWDLNQLDFDIDSSCCATGGNLTLYSNYNPTTFYVLGINLISQNSCPLMTSLECQTEYNLIPISSVDQNYCTTNNLCPSCPVCPVGSGGVSTFYINNVLHVGAPFIYMNIPEEIDRDYAYTQGGNNMNIDIEGYNQDAEYINGLIDINNYKPTTEDFNNTFSLFGSFGGLLAACLFVIFVFYLIKKIYK